MRSPKLRKPKLSIPRRFGSESGQSLVLAIIVMFLLVFLGIMFIVIISRNLTRTARSTDVTEATALAEAGIRYADRQLTISEEGADWRPVPENLGWTKDATGLWVQDTNIANVKRDHPDFKWLRPYADTEEANGYAGPTGGFTAFKTGGGRYLLRISYNPDPDDPLSKYIKIESIGRVGFVDENDPTTWGESAQIKLRRELTAYKPIGLTDYSRFITNKEKKNTEITLGCPGYALKLGDKDVDPIRGAPIRVNGNLTWYGTQVDVVLRAKQLDPGNFIPIDTVEVAGDIKHDNTNDVPTMVYVWENITAPTQFTATPSTGNFDTLGGFYRDGYPGTDNTVNQYARNVKRLEPPLLDDEDPATKLTRYRLLTQHSGEWKTRSNGSRYNTGRFGWGKGIYIDNRNDKQAESESLFGGYSLRADWTKPNNDMAAYWKGPYYVPPGAIIVLNPDDTDGDGQPDMTITRTDQGRNGRKFVWTDYNGVSRPDWGQTVTMPYPVPNRTITVPDPANANNTITKSIPGNGVLFTEGNIRIKGMMPPGVQMTVVSNATIYIEGNVLRNRTVDSGGAVTTDYTSAVSLLAKDYVCVNTTQFMSLMSNINPLSIGSDAMNGEPPYHLIVTPEPGSNFSSTFIFGPNDPYTSNVDPRIFIRHAGEHGPAYINMRINQHINTPPAEQYRWPYGGTTIPFFGVGDSSFGGINAGLTTLYRCDVWNLAGGSITLPSLNWAPGYPNYIEIGIDQSPFDSLPFYVPVIPEVRNYFLSAFAIQPMNIRIEAVLYAQDRSFFVIPGTWFNPNPNDNDPTKRPPGTDPRFPLFGQPLDVKVIVDGAVTENLPPPMGDVSEWTDKWGWIPQNYGSSSEPTAHNTGPQVCDSNYGPGYQGLTFLYDPYIGWPKVGGNYIRKDNYGRALPITPRLPVCQSLIYFGDAP